MNLVKKMSEAKFKEAKSGLDRSWLGFWGAVNLIRAAMKF
jgi:hypothetical protein